MIILSDSYWAGVRPSRNYFWWLPTSAIQITQRVIEKPSKKKPWKTAMLWSDEAVDRDAALFDLSRQGRSILRESPPKPIESRSSILNLMSG